MVKTQPMRVCLFLRVDVIVGQSRFIPLAFEVEFVIEQSILRIDFSSRYSILTS
jgi:hypothetical protein